ncbi:MAG: D-glycero-beta-D-manno-heptose 1,7-bisphosphate 7-phosphatase, partial [Candidatus Desantisbacteria bacterium]
MDITAGKGDGSREGVSMRQGTESRNQRCEMGANEVIPEEIEQNHHSMLPLQRVVFLDRDGVINKKLEGDYVKSYDEFIFLPGAIDAIKKIKRNGWMVIIITNQSGIGRGIMSEDDLIKLHGQMLAEMEKEGVRIDAIYYCPHSPDNGCNCRKPKDGLFKQALMDFNIDIKNSWMIGDEQKDVEAGEKAGCKT